MEHGASLDQHSGLEPCRGQITCRSISQRSSFPLDPLRLLAPATARIACIGRRPSLLRQHPGQDTTPKVCLTNTPMITSRTEKGRAIEEVKETYSSDETPAHNAKMPCTCSEAPSRISEAWTFGADNVSAPHQFQTLSSRVADLLAAWLVAIQLIGSAVSTIASIGALVSGFKPLRWCIGWHDRVRGSGSDVSLRSIGRRTISLDCCADGDAHQQELGSAVARGHAAHWSLVG